MKAVTLKLRHLSETPNSTVSALQMPTGEHICYIIEDGYRKVKVKHDTRIPKGVYEIVPRVDERSRFYTRYRDKFGHKFVPWLPGVSNFVWILIHIGNTISDTSGCLLAVTHYARKGSNYWGWDSTEAYLKLYDLLEELFDGGNRVYIEINRGQEEKLPQEIEDKTVDNIVAELPLKSEPMDSEPSPEKVVIAPAPTPPDGPDTDGCLRSIVLVLLLLVSSLWIYGLFNVT
jgi:hypothetical protein